MSAENAANLNQLCELTRQQLDQAGATLRDALSNGQQARAQLEQLHGYRHDYMGRAQQRLRRGLSGTNYHNFMQFLGVLEQALSMQNTLVEQLEQRIVQAREHWQQKKRQLDAYDALKARRASAVQVQQTRREQRLSDEHAAQASRRAAHGAGFALFGAAGRTSGVAAGVAI